ncbi:YkvA family protein [Fusobacterium sp. MFO224]|uniref:YkvA family protein n=1 Tax=Fusobacterium sp. MFO224 TaxID=3378070 RepID=UPI0038540848
MLEKNNDYYQKLRKKIRNWTQSKEGKTNKWSEYILTAPDLFHLLFKLSMDREVPTKEKAKLAAAIAYFICPLDFISEVILGPIGYVDDIALSAYVLNSIINNIDPEIVKRHWAGDQNILILIKKILEVSDEMVGHKWKKILAKFK